MYCGADKYRSKMNDINITKSKRNEIDVYFSKFLIISMKMCNIT